MKEVRVGLKVACACSPCGPSCLLVNLSVNLPVFLQRKSERAIDEVSCHRRPGHAEPGASGLGSFIRPCLNACAQPGALGLGSSIHLCLNAGHRYQRMPQCACACARRLGLVPGRLLAYLLAPSVALVPHSTTTAAGTGPSTFIGSFSQAGDKPSAASSNSDEASSSSTSRGREKG
eukprot:scaffold245129_cov26-Tisochrysis_lutea.AAC.1